MKSPNIGLPTFGLVTNGTHFAFLKLDREGSLRYALSDELSLKRSGNELYQVLGILRRLGSLSSGMGSELVGLKSSIFLSVSCCGLLSGFCPPR